MVDEKNRMKYIVCDKNKAPTHSFDNYKTLSEVRDEENVGILIESPYVIVDVDDEHEFEILRKVINKLNIKTRILKTSRGGHFWFKTLEPIKNVVHSNTPLTVKIDIKCWGKRTMEIVKRNGEWREWLQEDKIVDELPYFLTPMTTHKQLIGMADGDGRNDALFTFIMPLIKQGLTKEQIKDLFTLINEFVFDEPLSPNEIDAMIDNNDVFERPALKFYNGQSILHSEFADYMIERYHIKYYGKSMYIYDGRVYISDEDLIKAKMVEVLPNLKVSNVREAMENIKYKVLLNPSTPDVGYINVENGLLNIENDTLIPHTPHIFTINKLPVTYNKDAECAIVDKTLKSLCCNREELIVLLCQMMGYILVPDCRFQKAFILLGNGSNGKSLFLDMVRSMIGEENCSSLALEDLSDKFRAPEIVGKMLNIGDDSGHGLLDNTAIFKKLVTGDSMTFERKRQDPFRYANTAKMIFAANTLPPTTDKSDGFFRRCIIIPFDGVFRPGTEGYDPTLLYKVVTPVAKSYLLNLALAGVKQILKNQYFSESSDTRELIENYNASNNSVVVWLKSNTKEYSNLAEAYVAYASFCGVNGYKPINMGKFRTEYFRVKNRV